MAEKICGRRVGTISKTYAKFRQNQREYIRNLLKNIYYTEARTYWKQQSSFCPHYKLSRFRRFFMLRDYSNSCDGHYIYNTADPHNKSIHVLTQGPGTERKTGKLVPSGSKIIRLRFLIFWLKVEWHVPLMLLANLAQQNIPEYLRYFYPLYEKML